VTGGLTFGYTQDGPKGEKRWKIHEPEAAVVRRVYTMCADGYGGAGDCEDAESGEGAKAACAGRGRKDGVVRLHDSRRG